MRPSAHRIAPDRTPVRPVNTIRVYNAFMSVTWRRADDESLGAAPAWMRSWLAEAGSLTQRLKACCPAGFALEVIAERDGVLDDVEAAAMGMAPGVGARIREVHLCCGGEPRIYARSLLPHTTLTGAGSALAGLGARPLGDALFAYAGIERGPIEVARTGRGWGRRSVFRVDGAPVLVGEWFLDALARCTD